MKRSIFIFFTTVILLTSINTILFAQDTLLTQKKKIVYEEIIYEKAEIKDVNILKERVANGVSDVAIGKVKVLVNTNVPRKFIEGDKEVFTVVSEPKTTVQKLRTKKVHYNDGSLELVNEYAINAFLKVTFLEKNLKKQEANIKRTGGNQNIQLMSSTSKEDWDGTYSVETTATYYYDSVGPFEQGDVLYWMHKPQYMSGRIIQNTSYEITKSFFQYDCFGHQYYTPDPSDYARTDDYDDYEITHTPSVGQTYTMSSERDLYFNIYPITSHVWGRFGVQIHRPGSNTYWIHDLEFQHAEDPTGVTWSPIPL